MWRFACGLLRNVQVKILLMDRDCLRNARFRFADGEVSGFYLMMAGFLG